jgi:hypothetical protein
MTGSSAPEAAVEVKTGLKMADKCVKLFDKERNKSYLSY